MYLTAKNGKLVSGATTIEMAVAPGDAPFTINLASTDVGRKIEISSDGGVNYDTPTPTVTATAFLRTVVTYPITHVRITGAVDDLWSVL